MIFGLREMSIEFELVIRQKTHIFDALYIFYIEMPVACLISLYSQKIVYFCV
jgi:hypothetical protein